jgi:hypothetical protein
MMANPVSGKSKTAFSVKTLKSQANASSNSPPSAIPSINAKDGI